MSRGRKADPQRAARGTGHRPQVGEAITEYVPQHHSSALERQFAEELPVGLPRDSFMRAVAELGDRGRDTDLEALRIMAMCIHRAQQYQQVVDAEGLMVSDSFGNRKVNPALKASRDEANMYLKIANQYGLTFVSRLQAGIMQLAGESMLQQMHQSIAGAIVSRIIAAEPVEAIIDALPHVCPDCKRGFSSARGLASHVRVHQ